MYTLLKNTPNDVPKQQKEGLWSYGYASWVCQLYSNFTVKCRCQSLFPEQVPRILGELQA